MIVRGLYVFDSPLLGGEGVEEHHNVFGQLYSHTSREARESQVGVVCLHAFLDNLYLSFYLWEVITRSSCTHISADRIFLKWLELRFHKHRDYM